MSITRWLKKWWRCKQLNLCFECGTERRTGGAADVVYSYCPQCNERFWNEKFPVVKKQRENKIAETRKEFF